MFDRCLTEVGWSGRGGVNSADGRSGVFLVSNRTCPFQPKVSSVCVCVHRCLL